MNTTDLGKIRCSVGILTFNSATTLRRALESVKDFSDIIISDGGSTDETLAIAREYGATIIEQIAKHTPGPEPRHPITDFAAERNQMLKIAKEQWFLWIDSDEYISQELHDEIVGLVRGAEPLSGCLIPMVLQNKEATVTYRLPKPIYQMRLFNLSTDGLFQGVIHEKYVFPQEHSPQMKTLSGAWYVPISKPDFESYRWAVNYRLRLMNTPYPPKRFTEYLWRGWIAPIKNSIGILRRMLISYLTVPTKQILPLYYFRNRLYSQWVTFKVLMQLYFEGKKHE